jgi:hypothetical protein
MKISLTSLLHVRILLTVVLLCDWTMSYDCTQLFLCQFYFLLELTECLWIFLCNLNVQYL